MSSINRRDFLAGAGAILGANAIAAPVRSLLSTRDVPMLSPTASDYLQNGLVRLWDGIENVGAGLPHDPFAPAWIDHITGATAMVQSDSYWDDFALCRDDKANSAPNMAVITTDRYSYDFWYFKTVEMVCDISSARGFVFCDNSYRASTDVKWGQHCYVWTDRITHQMSLGHYSRKTAAIRYNTPVTYAFTQDIENGVYATQDVFVNGADEDEGPYGDYWSAVAVSIGGTQSDRAILGKIYALRFYDRVLSQQELAYNFSIDQMRFGI